MARSWEEKADDKWLRNGLACQTQSHAELLIRTCPRALAAKQQPLNGKLRNLSPARDRRHHGRRDHRRLGDKVPAMCRQEEYRAQGLWMREFAHLHGVACVQDQCTRRQSHIECAAEYQICGLPSTSIDPLALTTTDYCRRWQCGNLAAKRSVLILRGHPNVSEESPPREHEWES